MKKYLRNIETLILFLLTTCMLLTSCVFNDDDDEEESTYKRTLVVYLGRDGNLSGSSDEKIKYMLEGWNGKGGNLIIYQDTAGGNSSLMEVYREGGVNYTRTIEEYDNENSADPAVFKRVLDDAVANYPADSYGLIFFSHASGWLPEGTLTSPRSFVIDNGSEMDIKDLAAAIPAGYFDFIVFEACFSAGVDVAYELKDKTDYIVGSSAEILRPGYRDVYPTSMNYLFEKEAKLEAFTRNVFSYISQSSMHYNSATFSLIRTEGLDNLAAFLRENVDTTKIASVDVDDVQHFDRYSYSLFFDMEDYFSRILKDGASTAELSALIADCVPYKDATADFLTGSASWMGFTIVHHSGLTAYIPQERFPYLNEEYKKLAWYKAVFE